ncbi:hypothetical protein PWT90_06364 [Aphanocladium album]|nr:hypothetical protein PWT90_06364 [Aphanocladium album]
MSSQPRQTVAAATGMNLVRRESPPKNVGISVSDCASRESGAVVKPSPMIPIDAVEEDKKSVGQEVSGVAFAGEGKLTITNTEHRNQIRKQVRKKTRNRIRNQVNIVINVSADRSRFASASVSIPDKRSSVPDTAAEPSHLARSTS